MKLANGDQTLELHALQSGEGLPLLLLHPLHASGALWPLEGAESPIVHWQGPVFALDFSGHGDSGWRAGGFYSAELLAGDADLALVELGRAALLGRGLGAYVGLLLAGARPDEVTGALLQPGGGLAGAGAEPDFREETDPWAAVALGSEPERSAERSHDPMLCCLGHEIRPPDYAVDFARAATGLILADCEDGPPWWRAIAAEPRVRLLAGSLKEQLGALAANG